MAILQAFRDKWHSDSTAPAILDGSQTTSPLSSARNDLDPLPDPDHLSPTNHILSSAASVPIALPSHPRGRQPLDTNSLPVSLTASKETRSRSSSAISSAGGEKWFSIWRSPKGKQASQDQEHRTRALVATAVRSVIGTAAPIAHDILRFSSDALQFAPVPGLDAAAKSLLAIWDAVEQVKENRAACLRLTERCATILMSVRQDVSRAGDQVSDQLRRPQAQFESALEQVSEFMSRQAAGHFFTQLFQRDSILEEIAKCDEQLNDALGRFDRDILLGVFQTVLDTHAKMPSLPSASPPYLLLQSPTTEPGSVLPRSPLANEADDAATIREKIRDIQKRQNQQDLQRDMAEMRKEEVSIIEGMDKNQHEKVLPILGPNEEDQAEVLKTIRRAIEAESQYPFMRTPPAKRSEQKYDSPRTKAHSWPLDGGAKRQDEIVRRELIEAGLEYFRRIGPDFQFTVPDWTISRFEILRGRCVSQSASSHVYKGKWRQQTVAIKVLATNTPHSTFIAEVLSWKQLKHRHVLELYGASSGKGQPPWFFVSPFMKYGNLTQYLRHLEWEAEGGHEMPGLDRLGIIHDIAKGMEYLHSMNILHGDLRARNVLVDTGRCVVSDFSQSRRISAMGKSEKESPLRSRLRWQAPELMRRERHITSSIDIYSYAMCIVEVLTTGAVPWPNLLNDDVQRLVLDNHERPPFPENLAYSLSIIDLIHECWDDEPCARPPFFRVSQILHDLRESKKPFEDGLGLNTDVFFNPVEVASDSMDMALAPQGLLFQMDVDAPSGPEQSTPAQRSDASSLFTPSNSTDNLNHDFKYDSGYESPLPGDVAANEMRNARIYSIALSHPFDASLRLALWTPGSVTLGDVGYMDARNGSFITLCNAGRAVRHSPIPAWHTYGKITMTTQRLDLAHADSQESEFSADGPSSFIDNRKYTFPLSAGSRKVSYICAENIVYHHLETLEAPRLWFEQHADTILATYIQSHQRITKEDLILVIGTLSASHYALFVNYHSPNGQLHFDVATSRDLGEPWGSFSTTIFKPSLGRLDQSYQHVPPVHHFATKISTQDSEDTLLIARLQLGTDSGQATLR